ncbi:hypothetical protein MUP01_10930 [Candidatus Bathyarchaeota archaeon]|nr:hypothetical protein [Candidatus Bathyarchaeota archaeon]
MCSLKSKIREKIDELESENDRILKGVNEDCQLPDSQAQAILRSSYHNNGSIQGLKDALGLVDEATKQIQEKVYPTNLGAWLLDNQSAKNMLELFTRFTNEVLSVLEGAEQK